VAKGKLSRYYENSEKRALLGFTSLTVACGALSRRTIPSLATRGNNMENEERKNDPNKEDSILDPQATEEVMEMDNPTPVQPEQGIAQAETAQKTEEDLLKSSAGSEAESEGGKAANALGDLSLRRRRLRSGQRKRLGRLIQSGMPYATALATVLEEQAQPEQQSGRGQSQPSTAEGNKRLRSEEGTPEQKAKKSRALEHQPTYGDIAGNIRVGIIHSEHPNVGLSNEQLEQLQLSVLDAVHEITAGGPQVRFQGCSHRPGWLQINCADATSSQWLEQATKTLQPWEGATLKFVQGKDLPKPHICVAYLPDDAAGTRLQPEKVLSRLKIMNHGLNTQEWVILHRVESGPGQTWTFSVDEMSMSTLQKLEFRPFFGFGRVTFRPKSRGGKTPAQEAPENAEAVAGGSETKPLPTAYKPQKTKTGKGTERQDKPASKTAPEPHGRKGKGKSIPARPQFKKKSRPLPKEDEKNPKPPKEGGDQPPPLGGQ